MLQATLLYKIKPFFFSLYSVHEALDFKMRIHVMPELFSI